MTSSASGATAPAVTVASFRDPGGRLFLLEGRVLRAVRTQAAQELEAFLALKAASELTEAGALVRTRRLSDTEVADVRSHAVLRGLEGDPSEWTWFEHERVSFVSYPYEWPPEMLHAAGHLTLSLAVQLLDDGFGLKDGTPYNVLFRGPEPVFVDALSFERRNPADPTWLPYAQFVRTFLLPLLASRALGLPLDQSLMTRRDGLEPEEVYRWTGSLQRLRPPFLGLVSMPTWLASKKGATDAKLYQQKLLSDPEKAQFILRAALRRLQRALDRVAPTGTQESAWTDYMASNNNYSRPQFGEKEQFVDAALREVQPQRVLDVGCNTGHFSALAARHGAKVVAIDYDAAVLGQVWRTARKERLDILPLQVNLTRPTPGIGWRNQECRPFLERAHQAFDCVLMLAVIHHMLVTERVPLPEIAAQAADLTRDALVIEYVDPADSMFRRLTRGRDHLHQDLTPAEFEATFGRHFEIVRKQPVADAHRSLYLLRRRKG